jgi:hypothetical protein
MDKITPWGWAFIASTWIVTVLGWAGATFIAAGQASLYRRE